MESIMMQDDSVLSWNTAMLLYNSALKEMGTKIEILNDEFQHVHQYNPIEYVKTRLKSPESIVKKLKRYGYEDSIQNMIEYCNDIAGVRIVCSFTSDIYRLADMIGRQSDITVLSIKDYIKNPKPSGYKSYHMIVTIPIFLSDRMVDTKVEIQIRTIAMDFWASLEHKIYYKFEGHAPAYISHDLQECSKIVSELDEKMLMLNEAILKAKEEQEKKEAEEKVSVGELFSPKYRKNTLVGGIFYACQVFPYFGVGIFLPILIAQLNMGDANTSNILYDVFCMAGAFVGTWLCNRISRRRFLTSTFFGAAIALIVMIVGQSISIIVTVVAFSAFALIMSIAVVMEWPYPPELFDDRVRGTGVGIVIAFSRIGAALGTFLLPILMESIGATGTLSVCAAILIVGGVVCQIMAPETSLKHMKKEEKVQETVSGQNA